MLGLLYNKQPQFTSEIKFTSFINTYLVFTNLNMYVLIHTWAIYLDEFLDNILLNYIEVQILLIM